MSSNEQNLHICPECCSRFLIYFFSTTVRLLAEDLVQSWGAGHLVLFRLTGLSTVYRLSIALAWCRDLEYFDFSRADMFICTKSSFSRSVILKTILLFWLNLYIYICNLSPNLQEYAKSHNLQVWLLNPGHSHVSCILFLIVGMSPGVFSLKKKKKGAFIYTGKPCWTFSACLKTSVWDWDVSKTLCTGSLLQKVPFSATQVTKKRTDWAQIYRFNR